MSPWFNKFDYPSPPKYVLGQFSLIQDNTVGVDSQRKKESGSGCELNGLCLLG